MFLWFIIGPVLNVMDAHVHALASARCYFDYFWTAGANAVEYATTSATAPGEHVSPVDSLVLFVVSVVTPVLVVAGGIGIARAYRAVRRKMKIDT